ncbi:MAG: histidine phosphatase family protein [Solirubrobacteraceae bacterium MAG38_C4-C5]|nr:histidine phosphatase family protein [Candidatus Siliceabacter maunaloa]
MILLARHGETDDNRARRFQGRRDPPLNDTGRAQARALATEVRDEHIVALYASPLLRAWETATIAGAVLGLEPLADGRLVEVDVGDWAGRLHAEVATAEPRAHQAWIDADESFRFPGGEAIGEQRVRVDAAVADIRAAVEGPALLVCHGGTIRAALLSFLGADALALRPSNGSVHRLPACLRPSPEATGCASSRRRPGAPVAGGDRE